MTGMVTEMKVNEGPMAVAAGTGFSTATDLADWLVQNVDMPFREAHEVTGRIVRLAEDQGVTLDQLALEDLQTVAPAMTKEVYAVLDPARALAGRSSAGGTAPERVREAVEVARRILAEQAQ
jgi:argininosuccinate lyase